MGKTSRDIVNFTQDICGQAASPAMVTAFPPSQVATQTVRIRGTENSLELLPFALTVAAALDLV